LLKDKPEDSTLIKEDFMAKIIANATSYGIFVEINPVEKETKAKVYGLKQFICEVEVPQDVITKCNWNAKGEVTSFFCGPSGC